MADVDVAALRTQIGNEFPGLNDNEVNRILTDRLRKRDAYLVYSVSGHQRWWPTNVTPIPTVEEEEPEPEPEPEVVLAQPQETFATTFTRDWFRALDESDQLPIEGYAEITGGALVITPDGSSLVRPGIVFVAPTVTPEAFEVDGKTIQVELALTYPDAATANTDTFYAQIEYSDDDAIYWGYGPGFTGEGFNLLAYDDGGLDFGAYDPEAHRWLRMSLIDGVTTYSVSPDGETWTEVGTGTLDVGESTLQCRILTQVAHAAAGPAYAVAVSNLNVAPS